MPAIRIEMLGNFRVTVEGEPVAALHKNRLQSLLAYLALHRDAAVPREQLAFTLWPDSSESQARTNLRQLIHNLRHALPAGCDLLESDHHTVRWRDSDECAVDVLEFEAALGRAAAARERRDSAAERKALESAATVYRDDLLGGVYDEWLKPKRDRLRERLTEALDRLAALLADAGEIGQALLHAERLVVLDPLRESHYRLAMELHDRNGDRASALRAYHQCMQVLKRELGVGPGEATKQLFERVLKSEPREKAPESRPDAPATGLPMVGRRKEWEQLRECWRRAAAGESLLAVLAGEPGIGKSRLADELFRWAAAQDAPAARARCYAARGQLAYAPVEDWLKSPPLRATRSLLSPAQLEELARVSPDVLAEHPDLHPPLPLTDSWQRRHFFEALKTAVAAAVQEGRPVTLLIDDLQWCDRDSFGWLHFLLTSGTRGVLVVGTLRPEEATGEHGLASVTEDLRRAGVLEEIPVGPLSAEDAAALAARVANRELDRAYLQRLYQATKGNPLFVVESVRAKLEDTGAVEADVPLAAVPRVQAVIAARLTQLSAGAHELAGVAGAIGTAFSFELLARSTDWDEESVTRALDELWQRRIVESVEERRGAGSYDFTHDRLREVAYAELSPVRRRYLHRRIARALEELNAGQEVAGQIAAHCEAAGMLEEAVRRYTEAASVAQRRYADGEAAGLAARALALCAELPAGSPRDAQELRLLVLRAEALLTALGYATPEAQETHHRALEISERLGETEHRGAILAGAAFFHVVRGELETGHRLSAQLVDFAKHSAAPTAVRVTGHFMLGISLYHLGRADEGRFEIDEAVATCAGAATSSSLFGGLDMRVFCGAYRSHTLWLAGDLAGATTEIETAVALARREAHPFSLALALDYAALLRVFERDPAGALATADQAAALCRKFAFSYYLAWSEIVAGWARSQIGEAAGVKQCQHGIEGLKATGAQLRLPFYYALLAEAHATAGQAREALASVSTGFAFLGRNGEAWPEAELHRVHGEALESSGQLPGAAESYRKGVEAARRVRAAFFEQRCLEGLRRVGGLGAAADFA
jgi:DNA-binding SARP family transcriptional activator